MKGLQYKCQTPVGSKADQTSYAIVLCFNDKIVLTCRNLPWQRQNGCQFVSYLEYIIDAKSEIFLIL